MQLFIGAIVFPSSLWNMIASKNDCVGGYWFVCPTKCLYIDMYFTIIVLFFQACRSCVKKISSAIQTSGQVTSVENIQQLDKMADEVLRTSPRYACDKERKKWFADQTNSLKDFLLSKMDIILF